MHFHVLPSAVLGGAASPAQSVTCRRQVYDQFAELVAARVAALKLGDGAAADTTHGPLISPAGVEKVGAALHK